MWLNFLWYLFYCSSWELNSYSLWGMPICQRDTWTSMLIAALFATANTWNWAKCSSVYKWKKKMWYIYTVEWYLAIKKNEILSFAAIWISLENIVLSKISQVQKDKYCIISPACEILKCWSHKTNEWNSGYQRLGRKREWGGWREVVQQVQSTVR